VAYQAFSVAYGEQPSAAKWNILGTNDASFNDGTGISALTIGATTAVKNSYKFSVYRNAGWTASSGTQAKVSFDAATFDTGSNFDLVTNHRFVAPIAGFYWFSASVNSTLTAANAALIAFNKNSSQIKVGSWFVQGAATTIGGVNISGILQLSINDYIEVFYTGSGGAGGTGANNTWFDGFLVSAT
jgi:hypothetical protein